MQLTKTPILGLSAIHATVMEDHRGYFWECYQEAKLTKLGVDTHFVQENQSYSRQATVRGLHYQLAPHAQTKLVRVIAGEVWDVVVDLRQGAPTFGRWEGIHLSARNKIQLLVPRGYAHGFAVLSKHATILYKCDAPHYPAAEAGVHFLDPSLAIDWKLGTLQPILSEKDANLPYLSQAKINFTVG